MNLHIFNDMVSLIEYLNNPFLFNVVKPIVVGYIGKFVHEKYKINRKINSKYNFKIDLPPEVKEVHQDIARSNIANLFMKQEVSDFEENLKYNFSLSNLKLFYNNLESLNVLIELI